MSERWIGLVGRAGEELAGFSRQPVSFSPAVWERDDELGEEQLVTRNEERISFPPGEREWRRIYGFAVYDAPEDGHKLLAGNLAVAVEAAGNDTVEFAERAVELKMSDEFVLDAVVPLVSVPSMTFEEEETVDPYAVTDGWFVACPFCGRNVPQGIGHYCEEGK